MHLAHHRQLIALFALAVAGFLFLAPAAAQNPRVGDKAPDFAVPSSTGKEIRLADFAGKKAVVLFFYHAAFTNT